MTLDKAKALVASVPHWHHAFEVYPGLITPGTYDPTFLLDKTKLAANLRGSRVLDIGTSDGFFALQLARRGAEVVAIDYRSKQDHGYHVMERLVSSISYCLWASARLYLAANRPHSCLMPLLTI
jgi:tRNA (mo5U34)-methyltransferase